jgi:hypothetical protein
MGLRALLIAAAIGAAVMPMPARLIEDLYSMRGYLILERILTSTSNLAPFSLLDLLLIVVLASWTWWFVTDVFRRPHIGWPLRIGGIVTRTAVWASAVYLVFLAVWGLNYRRVPLADKLEFSEAKVSASVARALGTDAANSLNALYGPAHLIGWPGRPGPDDSIADAFAQTILDLGIPRAVVLGRPKQSLLDWYFRRAGVEGMTDPFFLETLLASDLLPFERPFVTAHEWSHLAGFADEAEANFVGWLACMRGSDSDRYSGWLFLYSEVARGLSARNRAAIGAMLTAGPRDDLAAIAKRIDAEVDPRLSAAGWRVYDKYLKANRIEEGAASYRQVVRLILGTRFSSGWRPELRARPESCGS